MRKLETDLRSDPQRGSRTYQSSIVKKMKRKKRWIYGGGFEDGSTKGEQDLPKLDSEDDEEEEEVNMRKLERYLKTDPQLGSMTYMKRKSRWK